LSSETRFCTRCGVDIYAAKAGSPGAGPAGSPYERPSNESFARPMGMAPPKNYLIEAIISTVCCCIPLGIAAIVFAAKVDGLASRGDYAGATEAANKAKMFSIIAVVAGLIANGIYLAVMLPGMMDEIKTEIQKQEGSAPTAPAPELTMPELMIVPK
jgi:hypothetical protein